MDFRKPFPFGSAAEAAEFLAPLRSSQKKLVTTNGCFDLLHRGHIQYLTEAASQGDLLAVGINSDESVRRLKGNGRPIQNELDRAFIIASLKMVTCSFIFTQDNPIEFIRILKPDVHVKGGDYTADIIERPAVEENGGRVCIVSFVAGRSTSGIIRGISGCNHG
jgi:glycerol-3-phosphate cytidylyltransferase